MGMVRPDPDFSKGEVRQSGTEAEVVVFPIDEEGRVAHPTLLHQSSPLSASHSRKRSGQAAAAPLASGR